MNKRLILMVILCVAQGLIQQMARAQNLDSLKQVLKIAKHDTARAGALLALGEAYYHRLPDTAIVLWEEAQIISEQNIAKGKEQNAVTTTFRKHLSQALNNLGVANKSLGNTSKAVEYYTKSQKIQEETGDTLGLAYTINNIGFIFLQQGDLEKALEYFNRSAKLWEGIKDKQGMAISMHTFGIAYKQNGDIHGSLEYFLKGLKIREDIGDKQGIAQAHASVALIYDGLGDFNKALNHYEKSLKLQEEIGDKSGIAANFINIGYLYQSQGEIPQALESFSNSLEISKEIGHKRGIANSLNNLGGIYKLLGEYDNALDHYQQGLKIRQEMDDKIGIARSLHNIGLIHDQQGNLVKALDFYEQSLQLKEDSEDKLTIPYTLNNIGTLHLKQKNYAKAEKYLRKSMVISQDLGFPENIRNAAEALFKLYNETGEYEQSLKNHQLFIQMRDSINNIETQKATIKHQTKYEYRTQALADSLEFAKKEAVMTERSEKQRLGLFAAGGGLLLLLALAFSIYSGKKKSEELLLNILPYETAQELKEKGHSDAQLIDEVTVLFTDFKGFTALSEQATPKELVADLHECFSAFDHICEKYGIEKIKTIGDAYMAAGGLPSPNKTHAQDVALAALEMAKVVEEGKAKKQATGELFFEIRIGVHTGPVVAGIVGVKKFQYDIWGDTVNTASRMESSGEVGKVNISQSTYELLKDLPDGQAGDSQFTFESRGKIKAKGKGEMEMYFVSLDPKNRETAHVPLV